MSEVHVGSMIMYRDDKKIWRGIGLACGEWFHLSARSKQKLLDKSMKVVKKLAGAK